MMRSKVVVRAMQIVLSVTMLLTAQSPGSAAEVNSPHVRLQEVLVNVSDIGRTSLSLISALKWEVIEKGPIAPADLRAWQATAVSGEQMLLRSPGSKYGYVRLVQLNQSGSRMRPGARERDIGGGLGLNLFVVDAAATIDKLAPLGWSVAVPLTNYKEDPANKISSISSEGRLARIIGPDDLVIGFQERIRPPLTTWPPFVGGSHIENVMELVSDIDAWESVLRPILGQRSVIRVRRADREIAVVRIGDNEEQLFTATRPTDVAETLTDAIRLPNLGIFGLRIAVTDTAALANIGKIQKRNIPPYGFTAVSSTRSGGGSHLRMEVLEIPR